MNKRTHFEILFYVLFYFKKSFWYEIVNIKLRCYITKSFVYDILKRGKKKKEE